MASILALAFPYQTQNCILRTLVSFVIEELEMNEMNTKTKKQSLVATTTVLLLHCIAEGFG